jgi:copper(I)-binding protein
MPVPANGTAALAPGGYHLMMLELKQPLKAGESFAGTLTFEKAGTIPVTFQVAPIGATAPGAGH